MDQITLTTMASAGAGVAGIFTLWRLVGRPAWRMFGRFWLLLKHSDDILETLKMIQQNFSPNGGSSYHDAVTRMEKGLTRIDERQKSLINLSDEGVFETDEKGLCTYANREYCEITGLLSREAIGNGWIVAIHENDRERVVREWRHAVADNRDFTSEFRFKRANGEEIEVRSHATPMRSGLGDLIGFIGTVRATEEVSDG